MLFFASSILFAAVVTARPSRLISRQEPVEIGGFKIAAANKIIPVVVGGPQDTFVPNTVAAAVGDIIQFQFSNGNHTVTQSAADSPCSPLQATVATAIHSGHIPFVDGQTTVGTFNMPVTSADTMFLYCATGPHCQEGQVMVVNPTDNQQIVDYAKGAQSTTSSVDGTTVSGGTVASIPLAEAAFVPAAAKEAAPPAAEAPADPAASSASSSTATDTAASTDTAAATNTTTTAADTAAATDAAATTTTAAGGVITTTVAAGATITLPLAADASLPGTTTVVVTVSADATASA
ncbi:hypothetical protein F4821DRAFT_52689 [Hypoxylon rubiginosum]|uniref:Uncharacterized protein n=1 Tax=Hypoxylon rubiginosum TaxID=110542 RepID=A0ACC0DAK5_9PEZI|nr:hypothetical protein F4821DRAFT_52689 [Hypoxylon rubiginosum]